MSAEQEREEELVTYSVRDGVAVLKLNRPRYRNAQNGALLYALDAAYLAAARDDDVRVIVLGGEGDHFSAGHDLGTPGRDVDTTFPPMAGMWWDHVGKPGVESRFARESELYLGLCKRWREIPKPTIAMVQGACVAGGLMLAWACDMIVAADDAFFADPVVMMGVPGVEFFAHPWVMGPRFAKEFLFLGERVDAQRARELGMVNRVVPRAELEGRTLDIAGRIAGQPRFGLALAKRAVNQCEDLMGFSTGLDSVFGLHHIGHAHSAETAGSAVGGRGVDDVRAALAEKEESGG
ncbi:enoyl-CoA hydratase [Actinomadura sp. KC345]|uniref:enoyl-CoA hydratase n=1 Tax=Actinomadura sp. KC345 TaxID=2530371 RepID=UPI00104DD928|nr:enoyl-CoA hydratase [Actinomadura sp. KC345]TDC55494.1 enoyl-CoA hydratase [Actinomadura sp. KC345]